MFLRMSGIYVSNPKLTSKSRIDLLLIPHQINADLLPRQQPDVNAHSQPS